MIQSGHDTSEFERLSALRKLRILDSEREDVFDLCSAAAARYYDCPYAFLSLVDEDRSWVKTSYGVDVEDVPRAVSFCSGSISKDSVTVFEDLAADDATRDSPLVTGELALRFYAGVPVKASSGHRIGVLCVCDVKPRHSPDESFRFLDDMARILGWMVEHRKYKSDLTVLTDTVEATVEEAIKRTGPEFLRWMVQHIARTIGADHVLVGELMGHHSDRVRTLAVHGDGKEQENFDYPLNGTPCAALLDSTVWTRTSNIRDEFPDISLFEKWGTVGYSGILLNDSGGRPIGILVVLTREPIVDSEFVESTLRLFAPRAAVEVERRRRDELMRRIVEGTASQVGEDLFRSLTHHLSDALDVKFAFMCELIPGTDRTQTLAFCHDGQFLDNTAFDLDGTPCDVVYRNGSLFLEAGATVSFPCDPLLRELGVEGYMGVLIRDSKGQPIGHLGVMHDERLSVHLTDDPLFKIFEARAGAEIERRRAERRRLSAERALAEAQKLDSLGKLAGGVAHDFNNLLVAIMGNVSLALEETPESSPLRPRLSEILVASRRAADLANQMLAYSGRASFILKPVALTPLVREMRELLQASVPKKITIEEDLSETLPSVVSDGTQLRQIIMNLVLNAVEATTDPNGRVRLRTDTIQVGDAELEDAQVGRGRSGGEYVLLEVSDTGCGIDELTLARVFDPYFTTKFGGRGLGLATVQGIVRAHQGVLRVQSQPGEGTTFQVLLPPAAVPEGNAKPESSPERHWRGSGTVLLVDDEESVRQAAELMLESIGFDVVTAATGPDGLRLLESDPTRFACVLLDVTMPGLDGREVLRSVRARGHDPLVILMSGYAESETLADDHSRPAAYLQKPFSVGLLRAKLMTILN